MYHSWGSQNAWLRQILTRNALYMNRATGARLGLADGDWVWITSPHGRVRAELRLMEGCGAHTVWTWNAIGKRAGAWALDPDAPEAREGFLLNHLISESLPANGSAHANADPITGQAAWYDLRVRVEKAEGAGTEPRFAPVRAVARETPRVLQYGAVLRAVSEERK
jgi:anaerobic selenocysteine-containing dehydrogenase